MERLLIDRLPEKSRHWVEVICLVIGIGFIGFFAFYACQLVGDSWRFNEMSQGVIVVPLWIPQIGYAAGLVILTIAIALQAPVTVVALLTIPVGFGSAHWQFQRSPRCC